MELALEAFSPLPLKERLFVRARIFSAPLVAVADRCPEGAILDVGCGHGVMIALLAVGNPGREVLGIDPDERKIAWARSGPGRLSNVSLRRGTIEDLLPELENHFEAILKEADANRSWKYFKCIAQEQLMVRLLGRTQSSGGLGLKPRRFIEDLLKAHGFAMDEVVDLAKGYTTPHILFIASRA